MEDRLADMVLQALMILEESDDERELNTLEDK